MSLRQKMTTGKKVILKLYRILFGSKAKQTTFKKWYKKNK